MSKKRPPKPNGKITFASFGDPRWQPFIPDRKNGKGKNEKTKTEYLNDIGKSKKEDFQEDGKEKFSVSDPLRDLDNFEIIPETKVGRIMRSLALAKKGLAQKEGKPFNVEEHREEIYGRTFEIIGFRKERL